jgi:hypothetical protein
MKCVLDNIGNSIEVTALGAIMLSLVIAAINLTTTYGRNTILKHMLTISAVLVTFIGEFVFLFTDGDFEFFFWLYAFLLLILVLVSSPLSIVVDVNELVDFCEAENILDNRN